MEIHLSLRHYIRLRCSNLASSSSTWKRDKQDHNLSKSVFNGVSLLLLDCSVLMQLIYSRYLRCVQLLSRVDSFAYNRNSQLKTTLVMRNLKATLLAKKLERKENYQTREDSCSLSSQSRAFAGKRWKIRVSISRNHYTIFTSHLVCRSLYILNRANHDETRISAKEYLVTRISPTGFFFFLS